MHVRSPAPNEPVVLDLPMPWEATENPAIWTVSVATYPAASPCPYCISNVLEVFWKVEDVDGSYMA